MNNKEYGVKLDIDLSKFQAKLSKAKRMAKEAQKSIEEPLRKVKVLEDGSTREIKIDTTRAQRGLNKLNETAKEFEERMKNVKPKIFDNRGVGDIVDTKGLNAIGDPANTEYSVPAGMMGYQIALDDLKEKTDESVDSTKDLGNEINEVGRQSTNVTAVFARFGDNVSNSIKKGITSIKRFTLSLIGIRSLYSMLSRSANAYMSIDSSLSEKMQANWIALGAIFAPIIEKIIALFQRLVAYVNVFWKAFTGKNLIEIAMNKYQKATNKAVKATKALNQELADFDQITNLNFDKGSGAGDIDVGTGATDGVADALNELNNLELNPKIVEIIENLAKRLKDVWNWIVKNKDMFIKLGQTVAIVFAGFKIGQVIGKLAELFGFVEKGASASGAFGLWGIAIAGIVADLKLAWELGKKIADMFEAWNQKSEAEHRTQDQNVKTFSIIKDNLNKIQEKQSETLKGSEEWEILERQKNEQFGYAKEAIERVNLEISDGKDLTKEQREEIEKQIKAIEKVSGKTFDTTIRANLEWSEKAKKFMRDNEELFNLPGLNTFKNIFNGITDLFKGHGGGSGVHFAKGNVAYEPTYAEFGEYAGARSNPEITAPQNMIRETLFEALADAMPLMGSSNNGDVVLNVNGKELARATYNDFKNESNRMGSSRVAVRRV